MHDPVSIRPALVVGPEGEGLSLATLPPPDTRWTARRKAQVVAAVAGGLLSVEEACARYELSLEEFADWRRSIEEAGLGARSQRPRKTRLLEEIDPVSDSTEVSLSAAVPPPSEKRVHHRSLSIFRVGKLISAQGEELCRVRNLSAGGIAVDLGAPRQAGERVTVEVCEGRRADGRIVWVRDTTIGIAFDEAVDIGVFLSRRPQLIGQVPRRPRVNLTCRARFIVGQTPYIGEVRDISQGGVKLVTDDAQEVGTLATVAVEGLGLVRGAVAWKKPGVIGIVFNEPIPFEELAGWLARRIARSEEARDREIAAHSGEEVGAVAVG